MSAAAPSTSTGTTTGLYGSTVGERTTRAAVAEAVGTSVLVYAGTSVAVVRTIRGDSTYDLLAVVLAFGVVLVALVASLGHVSGCHLNPAITIGLAATGRFPARTAAVYVVAQLVGGVLGSLATWVTYGDEARTVASLGASLPADGVPGWQVFVVEMLVTFVLVLVVVSVATDERAESAVAPVAVGAALAAAIFIAAPQTGGAVNPARAFGPDLLSGNLGPLWIYLVAPVVGGIAAAVLYDRLLAPAEPPA